MNEENPSGLRHYLETESARLKARTPEQRKADREEDVPGIFIPREESEEFLRMTPDEQTEKVKDLNRRLAKSPFIGPPHRRADGR